MKILIVGGAGYVGGGIVDLLSKENEVTVYDSLIYENSYRKNVNFILHNNNLKQKVEHIVIDHKFPEPGDPWKCQKYQRDYMLGYLDDIKAVSYTHLTLLTILLV